MSKKNSKVKPSDSKVKSLIQDLGDAFGLDPKDIKVKMKKDGTCTFKFANMTEKQLSVINQTAILRLSFIDLGSSVSRTMSIGEYAKNDLDSTDNSTSHLPKTFEEIPVP